MCVCVCVCVWSGGYNIILSEVGDVGEALCLEYNSLKRKELMKSSLCNHILMHILMQEGNSVMLFILQGWVCLNNVYFSVYSNSTI